MTGNDEEIVVTARVQISDSTKYVLVGGRYYPNPNYVDPAPWLNLKTAIVAPPVAAALAAVAPLVLTSKIFWEATFRIAVQFTTGKPVGRPMPVVRPPVVRVAPRPKP